MDQEDMASDDVNETITFRARLNIGRDLQMEIKQLKENISAQLNDLDPTKIRIIARGKLYADSYLLSHPFPIKNGDLIQATFPASLYKGVAPGPNKAEECN